MKTIKTEIWLNIRTIPKVPLKPVEGWVASWFANYNGQGTRQFMETAGVVNGQNMVKATSQASPSLKIRQTPSLTGVATGSVLVPGDIVQLIGKKDITVQVDDTVTPSTPPATAVPPATTPDVVVKQPFPVIKVLGISGLVIGVGLLIWAVWPKKKTGKKGKAVGQEVEGMRFNPDGIYRVFFNYYGDTPKKFKSKKMESVNWEKSEDNDDEFFMDIKAKGKNLIHLFKIMVKENGEDEDPEIRDEEGNIIESWNDAMELIGEDVYMENGVVKTQKITNGKGIGSQVNQELNPEGDYIVIFDYSGNNPEKFSGGIDSFEYEDGEVERRIKGENLKSFLKKVKKDKDVGDTLVIINEDEHERFEGWDEASELVGKI